MFWIILGAFTLAFLVWLLLCKLFVPDVPKTLNDIQEILEDKEIPVKNEEEENVDE